MKKKKIIYLHQYFKTPKEGGAIRSYHIAKAMVEEGHEVYMITAHNNKYPHYDNIDGIRVCYLPVFYENNLSFFGRIISFLKFIRKAWLEIKKHENVDFIYASSTPLTIGIPALLAKYFLKIPYYFEVRDLWPEAPIQLGIIKNKILISFLFWLEKKIYKNALGIIALSPGMNEGIKRKVPHLDILTAPNFSDEKEFKATRNNQKIHTLDETSEIDVLEIVYIGAIGKSNHLDYLLDAAKEGMLFSARKIKWYIAGKGSELNAIKHRAKVEELPITFLPYLNKEEIYHLLDRCDLVYISFADFPILGTNSPNKFFDAIAAGKPCIINRSGWIADIIEENKIGFYYDGKQAIDFRLKLEMLLKQHPDLVLPNAIQKNLLQRYSKETVLNQILSFVKCK